MKSPLKKRKKRAKPAQNGGKPRGRSRKTPRRILPADLSGPQIILAIDPGTEYLGWSIIEVPGEEETFNARLIGRGTVFGEGTGAARLHFIAKALLGIMDEYGVTVVGCEDYLYIPGKHTGIFAVPALLGVIKYIWYERTGQDAIMIESFDWKGYICGRRNASKTEVWENMPKFISQEEIQSIVEEYREVRGAHRGDYGEQDCLDSIGIALYLCTLIHDARIRKDSTLY